MNKVLRVISAGLVIIFLLSSSEVSAVSSSDSEDSEQPIAKKDVVAVRSFNAPRVGQFHIVVRKDGHQQKMPFLFELRATCGGPKKKWENVKVGNVQPSCDANVKTINYDPKKRVVSMMVRNVDWAGFDKKIREVGNDKAGEPVCKSEWEQSTLSLDELCPKN